MTDQYGPHFHLFIALAILEHHRTIVMRYLSSFDEILKFFNELSSESKLASRMDVAGRRFTVTMDAEPFLCQAEVLYLSLKEIVDKQDRKKAYLEDLQQGSSSESTLRNRKTGQTLPSNVNDVDPVVRNLLL